MTTTEITPRDLAARLAQGPVDLFDVRTPAEYREIHARPAKSLPLHELDVEKVRALRQTPCDQPVYVICRSGSRGKQASEKLCAQGCQAINVTGGTLAWEQAGLEVERGRKTISLERQVRIAAGALVLLGATLVAVSPWFAILPGFVGAGLIFAGVTDACGMGLLLSRMPWNR